MTIGALWRNVPRNVEEDGLEEEGETDPLVIFVVSNLLPLIQFGMRSNSSMSSVIAIDANHSTWNRKRRVDPAVCIHNLKSQSDEIVIL